MFNIHQRIESRKREFVPLDISPRIREIFGHFQNLNLLALISNLRSDRVAFHSWLSENRLCPVAHGMPGGEQVQLLVIKGQSGEPLMGCGFAARHIGADREALVRFVRDWDDQVTSPEFLVGQLEALWYERLDDAETVQAIIFGECRFNNLETISQHIT